MYKTKFSKLIMAVSALVVGMVLMPSLAMAADDGAPDGKCNDKIFCKTTGYQCYIPAGLTDGTCKKDTFGLGPISNTGLGNKPLLQTASQIINVVLSVLGIVAVVIILAAGFKWMTAGGNEEKTTEARKMIFAGIIGLAIILSAWAITIFVFNQLQKATGSGNLPPEIGGTN